MEGLEPLLPDERVLPVLELLYLEFPKLAEYDTLIATARIEPPWTGQLPTGEYGTTEWPIAQFIITSMRHPRELQRSLGIPHTNVMTAFWHAWEQSEKERKHFAHTDEDPARRIFRALAQKQQRDLIQFERMISGPIEHKD
jgi:hypothetical protein